MHMVRHQAPGMDCAIETLSEFLKLEKVERVVFFGEEARGPIVATLDDMDGHVGKHEAGATRHVPYNAGRERRVDTAGKRGLSLITPASACGIRGQACPGGASAW